MGEKQLEVKDN